MTSIIRKIPFTFWKQEANKKWFSQKPVVIWIISELNTFLVTQLGTVKRWMFARRRSHLIIVHNLEINELVLIILNLAFSKYDQNKFYDKRDFSNILFSQMVLKSKWKFYSENRRCHYNVLQCFMECSGLMLLYLFKILSYVYNILMFNFDIIFWRISDK